MSLFTPAALALFAIAIPILLLWMLKLRRRPATVSSTLLWERIVRDREANTPWQKLRRNLLLILQLAILALLVLALARPFLPVPSIARDSVVLLIDVSASMNATDVKPSRFAVARQAAEESIDHLGRDGTMSIVAVGYQPRVLISATADKELLRNALASIQPEQGTADWPAAFALAASTAMGMSTPDHEATIVIVSDGAGLNDKDLVAFPGKVRYVPVGLKEGTENVAITSLALDSSGGRPELFINLTHTAPNSDVQLDPSLSDPLLSIYVDGSLYESRRIDLGPGENLPLTFTGLPTDTVVVKGRILVDDALLLDNVAWAVNRPFDRRSVLLVSDGNLFLERAVMALPGIDVYSVQPDAPMPVQSFELVIFDGVLWDEIPAASLIVDPPVNHPLIKVTGTFSNTRISQIPTSDLMANVNFDQVNILQAKNVSLESWSWSNSLIQAQGGSLLMIGEWDGRRAAILTFDLHESDLPLQVAFPVLISNLVDWLLPAYPFDAGPTLKPGEIVSLYPGQAAVSLVRPDGSVVLPQPLPEDAEKFLFSDTGQIGLYQVYLDQALAGQFAVNLFDPDESNLSREENIIIGRTGIAAAEKKELGQKELWPWLALAALILLLVEWCLYHGFTLAPERRSGSRFRRPL